MICSKLDSFRNNCLHKLNVNDFGNDVKVLSQMVSKEFNINEEQFDLMCFGKILMNNKTLEWYGIRNGSTIFVLNKICFIERNIESNNEMTVKVKPNQSEIQHMVIALRTALMNASFRSMLDKLSEDESRENLMAVTPGLREDPTVFAILQDPDLLITLTEPTNIHKVLERHPCLLEAATYLSATFHEETIANNSGSSTASLLGRGSFNYSLDAMSDDEDMSDSEGSGEQQNTNNMTATQMANMISRAFQSTQNNANPSTSQPIITQDMLTNALRHSSQPPQPSTSSTASSTAATLRNWSTQLQQLRDLGINDEIVAIQALEATNGNVQSAIDIIFSDNN